MRIVFVILIISSLVSCAPRRPAKVDEAGYTSHRSSTKSNSRILDNGRKQHSHTVVKGDSLYSIGFRYQKDYLTLAAINNIKPPYRIYPKQVIKLTDTPKPVVFKPKKESAVKTQPMITHKPISPNSNDKKNSTVKKTTQPSVQTVKSPTINSKPNTKAQTKTPTAKKPLVVTTPNKTNLKWLWPTAGKIRTTFLASNPARKGISIGGKEGQVIKAAEAGVVVYSGNGLLGYGELIIIKHNDAFLSAYGHNKSLKVQEGQSVTRGQVIAELGSSGTNVNNLHFEIRKNGKPVNPLTYVKP